MAELPPHLTFQGAFGSWNEELWELSRNHIRAHPSWNVRLLLNPGKLDLHAAVLGSIREYYLFLPYSIRYLIYSSPVGSPGSETGVSTNNVKYNTEIGPNGNRNLRPQPWYHHTCTSLQSKRFQRTQSEHEANMGEESARPCRTSVGWLGTVYLRVP